MRLGAELSSHFQYRPAYAGSLQSFLLPPHVVPFLLPFWWSLTAVGVPSSFQVCLRGTTIVPFVLPSKERGFLESRAYLPSRVCQAA